MKSVEMRVLGFRCSRTAAQDLRAEPRPERLVEQLLLTSLVTGSSHSLRPLASLGRQRTRRRQGRAVQSARSESAPIST